MVFVMNRSDSLTQSKWSRHRLRLNFVRSLGESRDSEVQQIRPVSANVTQLVENNH